MHINRDYNLLTVISSILVVVFIFSSPVQASNKVYSFGVVPQQPAKRLAKLWTPLLRYISEQTGLKLRFKTAKNIPAFEKALATGEYDFAYMNPYHFTLFNVAPGYQAVAVRKDQPIKGIIVIKKGSEISQLNDLRNKNLAFPSPAAFAASLVPRAVLNNQAIPFRKKYVSSHDSVYLNVAKGLFDAGGGVIRTFKNTPPQIQKELSILWTSNGYTPHAIAAHPNIDTATRNKIQKALIALQDNQEGKKILQSLKIKHGLIAAESEDWNDIRELGVNVLKKLLQE